MKNNNAERRVNPIRYEANSKRQYRKQIQHIRKYRSGKWTLVNRGIRYQFVRIGPKTYTPTIGTFESAAKKVLDEELKSGRITGTEYNEQLAEIRRRAALARIKAYGSFDIRSFLKRTFPRKKYENWEDYNKRITFLDQYYFQQRTRKESIKNLPPVGKSLSSLPMLVEKADIEGNGESFTPDELRKLLKQNLPVIKGAKKSKAIRFGPGRVLKRAKPAKPKFIYEVPHPQRIAREIEEREKRRERIPEDFYDRIVSGLEQFKYV